MTTRFLIEVPHEKTPTACAQAVDVFLRTGSHFLSRADWGCKDGVHKAWMLVDVDSKDEARGILPPFPRLQAKIMQLNTFTIAEIEDILRQHES